jgi:hypothetical protein|tara:strand:+ start:1364 stop:1756 length:393 start_codon:yes stop_codon:yes gene_type:complete
MTIKDKIINHALNISCEIFRADRDYVLNNNNRSSETIKAKRMFIYYLYKYMEVTHNGMNKYFKTINHASSIHHVNKFHFELQTYEDVKKDFNTFLTEMKRFNVYGGGFYEKRKEIKKLLEELNQVKNEKN